MTSIDKIKAVLSEINEDKSHILAGRQGTIIKTLAKALEIAVDFIQVNEIEYRNEFMDKAADNNMILKQIKETLQNDS